MDIRSAWRSLTRTPGFSALAIVTLALGIGATTTMFSVAWAVALRPLPYPQQDRLVTIWESDPARGEPSRRLTPANFVDWAARSRAFAAIGTLPNWSGSPFTFNVAGPDGTERVGGVYASSGFFAVMGVAPMLGRPLGPEEDRTRGLRRAVISETFWRTQFDADPAAIGRTFEVDTFRGGAFTVVGVMPAHFEFPRGARLWLSLGDWGAGPMPVPNAAERCCAWYTTFGRLKPGVSIERAREELAAIAQAVSAEHPGAAPSPSVRVVPLRETLVGEHAMTVFAFSGAVGGLLLIGCANVANLLLTRAVGRRREVLTRLALGATRWRVARQFLIEGLLLGAGGVGLGLLLSMWAHDLVVTMIAGRIPLIESLRLDGMVIGFAMVLTLLTSTACGLVPLVDWSRAGWNDRGQSESRSSRRMRNALAIAEIAVAVTLVAGTGLLMRTVANLRAVDVGFTTERTLVVSTDLTTASLRERGRSARFIETALPRIAALPGVRATAATTGIPLEGGEAAQAITRQGDVPRSASESPHVVQTAVTPGYFAAMGIAVRQGRSFTEADDADGTLVAVINDTAARRYWPGEDPIGRRFAVGSRERFGSFRRVPAGGIEWREIVGVVSDVRSSGAAAAVQPEVYYTYKQFPLYEPAIVVRTSGDPGPLVPALRQALAAGGAVVTGVRTLDQIADESIADPTLRASLAGAFSGLALFLGTLGIYGVMSYTVSQQRREIGIRVALGASPPTVVRIVLGQALRLTAVGVMLGLAAAYAVGRTMSGLFFGVGAADATTLTATCLLLFAVSLAASAGPTRHALRVEPTVALREE